MDRELRELWRGYRDEQRRMADSPESKEQADEIRACPFGREWCDPSADLSAGGGFPCLSCWLRIDRDDGGLHPEIAAVADEQK